MSLSNVITESFNEIGYKGALFTNISALDPSFVPNELPGREKKIKELCNHLGDAHLRNRSCLIYGKTGTGKSAVMKLVTEKRYSEWLRFNEINGNIAFVNCLDKNTRLRIIGDILYQLGMKRQRFGDTDMAKKSLLNYLKYQQVFICILDEIDQIREDHRDILYFLSSLKEREQTKCWISTIGISNKINFFEQLDPRIQSRMGEESFVFKPYNAEQLRVILEARAKIGIKDDALDECVIPLVAAYAAQEHGDARKAIRLLGTATEVAGLKKLNRVDEMCVREAKDRMEVNQVRKVVDSLPLQPRIVLASILKLDSISNGRSFYTGGVYNTYRMLCSAINCDSLTQRRIGDLISDLDMLGIINARVVSKGRYGRKRCISLMSSIDVVSDALYGNEELAPLKNVRIEQKKKYF